MYYWRRPARPGHAITSQSPLDGYTNLYAKQLQHNAGDRNKRLNDARKGSESGGNNERDIVLDGVCDDGGGLDEEPTNLLGQGE